MIQSLNPATGKLLRSFDPLTSDDVHVRIGIAADAARTYPAEPLEQRIFWMRRLAALLDSDIEELAALMTAEMGKTLASARAEVQKCALGCRYYADNAQQILAPQHIPDATGASNGFERYVRYDPIGVILAVMPWNFPLWQVFRFAAPALVAGNVCLLKHASNVPQCALAIEALIRRAGFPRGAFQTLLVEVTEVETILADDRIAAVTVTGSEAAGRAIAAQAGWLIKKSVLELGGSDPFIVMPSANLDEAVANAVKSRTINNGQSCIAAKRFLIHEDIYSEFEKRFTYGMASLNVGDPTLYSTDVGPLATPRIVEDLITQVAAAKAAGGRILTGGDRVPGQPTDNYFQPTVIAGVSRNAAICKQEIFGPVALIFRVGSLEEAVTLANDTPFGLGASIWTADPTEQQLFANGLQCGGVFFNQPVASDPTLPFGGTKRSGYGRELSAQGMLEFLNAKTVVVAPSIPKHQPMPVEATAPLATAPITAAPPKVFRPNIPAPEPLYHAPGQPEPAPLQTRAVRPVEFAPIADRTRNFEPRHDNIYAQARRSPEPHHLETLRPESHSPEPQKSASGKPEPKRREPRSMDELPPALRLAPIIWDTPPEPRRLAPIILDSTPEPRHVPKLVFGDDRDFDTDDAEPMRGSILGLN